MLHIDIKETLEREFQEALSASPELLQDALKVQLKNGVAAEIRFADADAYSIEWLWGDVALRIDTAPLHPEAGTFPNHLHDADGQVRADPLTRPGADPWANVRTVFEALLADPLLQGL